MYKPLIKICGITNIRDAELSLEAGADMIGFNFYEKSTRYIVPEKAAEIINGLKKKYKFQAAGVFVNPSKEFVNFIINTTAIDVLQFHGDESPSFITDFSKTIIKVFRIRDKSDIGKIYQYDSAEFILLDSFSSTNFGGTGNKFDWDMLGNINCRHRLFLSGGLTASNIFEAIDKVKPYAVDICSGLEKEPCVKDPEKIKIFFETIRKYFKNLL